MNSSSKNPFDLFECICCITAPGREEFLLKVRETFEECGISKRICYINAENHDPQTLKRFPLLEKTEPVNKRNRLIASLLHIEIVKMAKQNGFENVLIFEDDSVVENFQPDHLYNAIEKLETIDWDIFYLSYNLFSDESSPEKLGDSLLRIPKGYDIRSASAYAVNSSAYDRVIQEYSSFKNSWVNIDVWLQNDFNKFALFPLMLFQDQLFSGKNKKDWFKENFKKHDL